MPDAKRDTVDALIGRSLLTAEAITAEFRQRLLDELFDAQSLLARQIVLDVAREILDEYEPLSAQMMTDAEIASWVAGLDSTFRILPDSAVAALEGFVTTSATPPTAGAITEILGGGAEPVLRFPVIENAAQDLLSRGIVTRADFDLMTREARANAFTVAFLDSEDTISTIRDVLAETVTEGASLGGFRDRLDEAIGGSRLGPAHLETVYRTNIQTAFHRGVNEMADNFIVDEVFPYQEYLSIRDGRVREEHLALGSLGLNGTGVYRRDDPMWELFTPPWSFNCRCGINLLTIDAAARKGVVEAQIWLSSGIPPASPEWRINDIPFRPDPAFA